MTKKHYDMIAAVIKATGTPINNNRDIAIVLARHFATDNPKFQRDKFLAACGIKTK